jgi:hypothetical protein
MYSGRSGFSIRAEDMPELYGVRTPRRRHCGDQRPGPLDRQIFCRFTWSRMCGRGVEAAFGSMLPELSPFTSE